MRRDVLHRLDSSAVAEHMSPHPPLVEDAAAMALSNVELVEGCPLLTWELGV